MQATGKQVGVTETDAPPLVNSIRKPTQKKVSALALLGAWGPPQGEAAPRSSHDQEDGAGGSRPGSRAESRLSTGSRERKGWSFRPSSRDASYALPDTSWSRGGLQGKTKIAMIQTPRDGMLGIITEVPVEQVGRPRTREGRSRPRTGESRSIRPRTREGNRPRTGETGTSTQRSARNGARSDGFSEHDGEEAKRRQASAVTKKVCCGKVPWPSIEELPDLPVVNVFGMPKHNPIRAKAIKLSVHPALEKFWLLLAVVHFAIALPEMQDNVFGCSLLQDKGMKVCKYSLPPWHHYIFLSLFLLEACIKIVGLGMTGGKFAWWTHDFYNKIDVIALGFYIIETVMSMTVGNSTNLSLRGFRTIRLLQPLANLDIFSDLEIIFDAFAQAILPMTTVLLFIWFILILFAIMGMAVWGQSSFRRRCVWADTLAIKTPEVLCKRNEFFWEFPNCVTLLGGDLRATTQCAKNPTKPADRAGTLAGQEDAHRGLDSNCGPLQLCLDVANPNFGFTSFDHLPSALITLFQVLSGDSDSVVLWNAIQSEPASALLTRIYFVAYLMFVLHVLINVFVAVFANVFADCRSEHQARRERERGESRDSDNGSTGSWSSSESDAESAQTNPILPSQPDEDEDESLKLKALQQKLEMQKTIDKELREAEEKRRFIGTREWLDKYISISVDPSVQRCLMVYCRDNDIYDTIVFTVTLTQVISIALTGELCGGNNSCTVDIILGEIVSKSNIVFIVDLVVQIVCDGSVAKHMESGENVFNFIVTVMTTTALLLSALGLSEKAVKIFTAFSIFRALRMCKYFFLKPIWLMLVKSTGSLTPVMNLCLFNTLLTVIYYAIGRSLFQDSLAVNFRYNFSSMSRGYMLLLTVQSGDGWSSIMYEAMYTFCRSVESGGDGTCHDFYVVFTALFYILWFFYGQFLFLTMFLAIILEAFAVDEFMEATEVEEIDLQVNQEEAKEHVAKFQQIPIWKVHPGLIKLAWIKLSNGQKKIPRDTLMIFVRIVQPMTTWRTLKSLGIIKARQWLRKGICMCFAHSWLAPYPGDEDFLESEIPAVTEVITIEEAEAIVAKKMRANISAFMKNLVKYGITGEVLTIAKSMDILEHLDMQNLHLTEPLVALKILRHWSISKRLGIEGFFDGHIQDVMTNIHKRTQSAEEEEQEVNEFEGLNLVALEGPVKKKVVDTFYEMYEQYSMVAREWCFSIVLTKTFNGLMLATIIVSSIFLCLETPDPTIKGILSNEIMKLCETLFTLVFVSEAGVKICAFGFYRPKNIGYMSYMQQVQNQVDALVLIFAIMDMANLGKYVGNSTTKVIRLMKVMRPVRLLLRSEGLKQVLVALYASLKPMAYATLFLCIVCLVFAVMGMAMFRNKYHSCTDTSLDGLLGEGRLECSGQFLDPDRGYYAQRVWKPPPFGHHFDSLQSSFFVLFRVLTLNWATYFEYAQDAHLEDMQPVPGKNMIPAAIYFHLFLLVGSFFGLNLFASFMCDTFYSLQGTAQLEEVQWVAVNKMLSKHQPKKIRLPPRNFISSALRQMLASKSFQNASALGLLLNVTFMGSQHSTQNSHFDKFLDEQNTVFFSFMCTEAGLNLLSLGPILYVTDPAHQYDLFIITATSATMLFQDSLRSLSQTTRMLRLFKFLRQLAKDRTIANVFETVSVSAGQVGNIMIILVVIVVMLAVLAVQLFGTVRFGNRLGPEANFASFGTAAHTIVQLMFGEDFPTLWDDCRVAQPSCTPDIVDGNGKKIAVSDCASSPFNANWFFMMVPILTNSVMLNLFVGMIMNNFAYISAKDGNGAVEDEDFIDAAYKYTLNLDSNLLRQIPLEKVYQFYNMVGAPLGRYGTSKNTARFLCIREELKFKMRDDEARAFSWWWNKVYFPIAEELKDLTDRNLDEWKLVKNNMVKAGILYRDAVGNNREALEEVGLEYEENEIAENAGDETKKGAAGNAEDKIQKGDGDEAEAEDLGASRQEEDDAGAGSGFDNRREDEGTRETIVSGGNMGQAKPSARVKKIKSSLRKSSTSQAIEKQLEEQEFAKMAQLGVKEDQGELIKLKKEFVQAKKMADELPQPKPTWKMAFYSVLASLTHIFLPFHERNLRQPGHVHYNEIMLAMLYWNKERNIVPQKQQEARKNRDDLIKFEVAFQIISAVIRGAIVRRRRRIMLQQAREKLQRANAKLHGSLAMNSGFSEEQREQIRREKLKDEQDTVAKRNLENWSFQFGTPSEHLGQNVDVQPLKMLGCKMLQYGIAQGHDLADAVEDLGERVGPEGLFELDEETLEICFRSSKRLQNLRAHVEVFERIRDLISVSDVAHLAVGYLQLAARKYNIEIGSHFQNLHQVPVSQLQQLLDDPHVKSILPRKKTKMLHPRICAQTATSSNAPGGPGKADGENEMATPEESDDEAMMKKIEEEERVRKEIALLKEQYTRHEHHLKETSVVLEMTYTRASQLESALAAKRANHDKADDQVQQVRFPPDNTELQRDNSDNHHQAQEGSGQFSSFQAMSAATFSASPTMLLPGQLADAASDEPNTHAAPPLRSSPRLRTSILDSSIPEEDSVDLSPPASARAESPGYETCSQEEERLNMSLQIAQADMERLTRSLKKAQRLVSMQKQQQPSAEVTHNPDYEKRMAEARARRAAKDNIEVDSDSAVSGLLSPRDKALRTDLKRREEAKKAKMKAAERRK